MTVPDLIRDSFFGQLVYHGSKKRRFIYAEESPDFVLPDRYASAEPVPRSRHSSYDGTLYESQERNNEKQRSEPAPEPKPIIQEAIDEEKGGDSEKKTAVEEPVSPELVDWYGPDDPERPQNWSFRKRCFVTFDICLLAFSVYIGSALYAPGTDDVAQKFGISTVAASLGLTMFVLGYGIGPMFLSPLSEIPWFGRTSVYIVSLILFVLLQIPTALAKNLGALLPLRFLAGFLCSPALSTSGASLADMWGPEDRAVVLGLWALAGTCGPVLGPLIGGFAAMNKGWTWTIWILMWLSGATCIFLFFLLPETSSDAILYRRAVRLRKLTGNPKLKSQGELAIEHLSVGALAMMTLVRPFTLAFLEPVVALWDVYTALVYGILYLFIESFPVIFVEHHGFNLGENGLAFLGLFFGAIISYVGFIFWIVYKQAPKFKAGTFTPEDRLPVAIVAGILLPISMFWVGWTGSASVPWIVPIIGSAFFLAATYLMFQAGLNYLPDCYPRYVASIMAGNTFFRSCFGAAFPLFGNAYFHNLGVGPACSILGGIACLMLPFPIVLYLHGPKIRAWSKYAG